MSDIGVLDHSRDLDVHTWSEHPEVNTFVDLVFDDHFSDGPKGIRKKHVKVVLLDLYVAWCDDPDLKVSYSRNVNDYKAKTRYNSLHISKLTIEVINILEREGYVETAIGFLDRGTGHGRLSRMWPTGKLTDLFTASLFSPLDIGHHEERECVILRNDDGDDVEYVDTTETIETRKLLEDYNNLLKFTFIDIPTLEHNWFNLSSDDTKKPTPLYINQKDKFVRRIFNRSSFTMGGRFSGGWWQRCPKELRGLIFMDDQPVSEIDYSGVHIVLLYAKKGIDYWSEIGSGPYTIERPDSIPSTENIRDVCKELLLIAINARDEASTFTAFRSKQKTGSPLKRLTNGQLKEVLDALRNKHPVIEDSFASDVGVGLMYTESQIAKEIIGHFTGQDIPVLVIHDSFLVPLGYEDELASAMQDAFEMVTGISQVKMKEETEQPHYDWEPLDEEDMVGFDYTAWEIGIKYRCDPNRSDRYTEHWGEFKIHCGKSDRASWLDYPEP